MATALDLSGAHHAVFALRRVVSCTALCTQLSDRIHQARRHLCLLGALAPTGACVSSQKTACCQELRPQVCLKLEQGLKVRIPRATTADLVALDCRILSRETRQRLPLRYL